MLSDAVVKDVFLVCLKAIYKTQRETLIERNVSHSAKILKWELDFSHAKKKANINNGKTSGQISRSKSPNI